MKNLLLLTLLIIGTVKNGQAKSIYYLFTDTQKEVQDSTVKNNPAMWIIDFEKSIITVQTETEDRIFSFNEYQKVKSIGEEGDLEHECSTLAQCFIVAQMLNLQRQPLFCQCNVSG